MSIWKQLYEVYFWSKMIVIVKYNFCYPSGKKYSFGQAQEDFSGAMYGRGDTIPTLLFRIKQIPFNIKMFFKDFKHKLKRNK